MSASLRRIFTLLYVLFQYFPSNARKNIRKIQMINEWPIQSMRSAHCIQAALNVKITLPMSRLHA